MIKPQISSFLAHFTQVYVIMMRWLFTSRCLLSWLLYFVIFIHFSCFFFVLWCFIHVLMELFRHRQFIAAQWFIHKYYTEVSKHKSCLRLVIWWCCVQVCRWHCYKLYRIWLRKWRKKMALILKWISMLHKPKKSV